MKKLRYQQNTVAELLQKTITLLNRNGDRHKLVLKAPTGAGKTVMVSEMLSMLTEQLPNRGDCAYEQVACIWIAPNKLHMQSYMKMKNYFTESHTLKPVMYGELDHSLGYIRPGEILFVNWESINKDNAIMTRDDEHGQSLYDITSRTQQEEGLPIIVIIDEEHMFANKETAKKSEKVLHHIMPKLEIRISATPVTNGDEMVNVFLEDVIAEQMVKRNIVLNPNIDLPKDDDDGLTAFLVRNALHKRDELAQAYRRLGVRINPLLLIQLPNDSNTELTSEDRSVAESVRLCLRASHGISTENHRLAIWLSGEKENLEGIESPDNMTEVLLFKQAIALGWDCPRAAVLLIFRRLESFQFTIQTVGRILRMPEQHHYTEECLNVGYVYTDLSKDKIQIVADDMNYLSRLYATRRPLLSNILLTSTYMERLSGERNRLGADFKGVLAQTFANELELQSQPTLFSSIADFGKDEGNATLSRVATNRAKVEGILKLNVRNIMIRLSKNVEFRDEVGTINIDESKRIGVARTAGELNRAYMDFCQSLLGQFEKLSTRTLANYLNEVLGELFNVYATDAIKLTLYHENRPRISHIVANALANYRKIIADRQAKAMAKAFKQTEWEIPQDRTYNEATNEVVEGIAKHALTPYIRLKNASEPERMFANFLESHGDCIEWWYKNGDSGQQNFAVPYTNSKGNKALFYVDFILKMKNGQVLLFDTKSTDSDPEAVIKHNALQDYMATQAGSLKGGIILYVPLTQNWLFCPGAIANTSDTTDWTPFNPEDYK